MEKLLLILGLLSAASAFAVCPRIDLPVKFKAQEELISIGTDVLLSDGKVRFGEIEERTLRLTPTFELFNIDGLKIATASKKFFSWGTTIEVKDCEDNLIGSVKENIFKSFFKFYTSYDILDSTGKTVATTKKFEFFAPEFIVTNVKNEELMILKRRTFNILVDTWNVEILRKDVVDPRIMIMIPAFKTSADNKKSEEEKEKK